MGRVAPFRFLLACCVIAFAAFAKAQQPAAPPGGAYLQLLDAPGERHASGVAAEPFDVEAGKTHTFDLQLPAK